MERSEVRIMQMVSELTEQARYMGMAQSLGDLVTHFSHDFAIGKEWSSKEWLNQVEAQMQNIQGAVGAINRQNARKDLIGDNHVRPSNS